MPIKKIGTPTKIKIIKKVEELLDAVSENLNYLQKETKRVAASTTKSLEAFEKKLKKKLDD
jgi:hypothetical protein